MRDIDNKNKLDQYLDENPELRRIREELKEKGFWIHAAHDRIPEWDLLGEEEARVCYHYLPIASTREVERMLNRGSMEDFILKLRADSIVDNMRILRTFHARAREVPKDTWTLASQFDDSVFRQFKKILASPYRERADAISYCTIFTDKPNAYCASTRFGPLILFSEALRVFFYYMNLAFFPFLDEKDSDVPLEVRRNALVIGLRAMLLKEAFDFEIDPRGMIPAYIDMRLQAFTQSQLLVVVGHEFGHFFLGHLDDKHLESGQLHVLGDSSDGSELANLQIYTKEQGMEFAADAEALEILRQPGDEVNSAFYLSGILAMCHLDLFEAATSMRSASAPSSSTHPSAAERRRRLTAVAKRTLHAEDREIPDEMEFLTNQFKALLPRLGEATPDLFESYGSVYLDVWRGPAKVDREDY